MIKNTFFQKIFLTMFWGLCAACLIEFYRHWIWQANEDINGDKAVKELYGTHRQVAHPANRNSQFR